MPDRNSRGRGFGTLRALALAAGGALLVAVAVPVIAAQAPPAKTPAAKPKPAAAAPKTATGAAKTPAAKAPAGKTAAKAPAGGAAKVPAAPGAKLAPLKPAVNPAKAAVNYTDVPMAEEKEKKYKPMRVKMQGILRNGAFASQQEQSDFEDYYQNYSFARWDDLKKAYLTSDFRLELSRELQLGKSGAAHQRLIEMAMPFFTARIKDPKSHPAVRVNAMLLIGDLNQKDTTSPVEDPVPLPAALPILLEALNDPAQIDGVKAAALIGIIRHVTLGVKNQGTLDPAVLSGQIVPPLLKLATTKVEPKRSPEGHGWLRARAIDALAAAGVLGDAQDPAKVPEALTAIVGEEEAQMLTRCTAAQALGKLSYPAGLGLDPVPVAASLGKLAAEIGSTELERAENEAPVVPARPMGYSGYSGDEYYDSSGSSEYSGSSSEYDYSGSGLFSGSSMRPGQPKEDDTVRLRRRLKSKLADIWEGLIGSDRSVAHYLWSPPEAGNRQGYAGISLLATTPEQQKFVEDLLAQLKKVMDLCDDKETLQEDLITQIQTELDALNQTLAAVPAGAAPAAVPAEPPAAAPEAPAAPAAAAAAVNDQTAAP